MAIKPHNSVKWGVHVSGPDSILAAHSFEEAVTQSNLINTFIIEASIGKSDHYPIVFANVIIWPDNCEHDPAATDWNEFC